jgi:hypothetical protein
MRVQFDLTWFKLKWDRHTRQTLAVPCRLLQLLTCEVRPHQTAECGKDHASEGFGAGNAKRVLT